MQSALFAQKGENPTEGFSELREALLSFLIEQVRIFFFFLLILMLCFLIHFFIFIFLFIYFLFLFF